MKIKRLFVQILYLSVLVIPTSCTRDNYLNNVFPEARFSSSFELCLTTDTLDFDASESSTSGGNKLYFRWDWDADGIWDTEFQRNPLEKYRYFTPGKYNPILQVINSQGHLDTAKIEILVQQGYSAPHANFKTSPDNGNFADDYFFDASVSFDDEDSLNQLEFRWDLDGNGSWDTRYKKETRIQHKFTKEGSYSIGLQVKDPGDLNSVIYKTIEVSNQNPDLVANFEWTPKYGTTADTFILDASSSFLKEKPFAILFYSWKLPPGYEWTEWDTCKTTAIHFQYEIEYEMALRIRDTNYLQGETKKKITVYHENLPPEPNFIIGCKRGNIRTQFYFDSWPTRDPESTPTQLTVRWDFNGDGAFETPWLNEKKIYFNFPEAGTYKVILEAKDPEGLSDTTSQYVIVSPYTNETGLIFDFRDEQIYGTVKIGNQWWMSENLNFAPWEANKDYVEKKCYQRFPDDPVPWCTIMGGLYNVYHATRNGWWHDDVQGICPLGWHIPTKGEWETLVDEIGGWNSSRNLLIGSKTDFNAQFAGFYNSDSNNDPFQGLGEISYFWSFKQLPGWPIAQSCWNIALIKDDDKIYPGYSGNDLYLSVRCIKDEE